MIKLLKQLWRDDSGISAIEYALIAGAIALAVLAGAQVLGPAISDKFNTIASDITNA